MVIQTKRKKIWFGTQVSDDDHLSIDIEINLWSHQKLKIKHCFLFQHHQNRKSKFVLFAASSVNIDWSIKVRKRSLVIDVEISRGGARWIIVSQFQEPLVPSTSSPPHFSFFSIFRSELDHLENLIDRKEEQFAWRFNRRLFFFFLSSFSFYFFVLSLSDWVTTIDENWDGVKFSTFVNDGLVKTISQYWLEFCSTDELNTTYALFDFFFIIVVFFSFSIDQTTLTVRLLVNRHAQSHVFDRIESNWIKSDSLFHSSMFVIAIEVSLLPRREEFGHAIHSLSLFFSLDEMDDDDDDGDRCSIGNVVHEHEQFNHLIKFSFSQHECVRSS